jgi:hypothetical protein
MSDSGLDAFAEEPTAATPDTVRNPKDTAVKVVFTDEQLASPLDVFAEEQQGRYEISADPLDSPLIDVEEGLWLDPAASAVDFPAGPVLQPQRTRHVRLVLAAIVLLLAVLHVAGRSVVGEFGAAPRAVTSATMSAPAAFSEKTTALPILTATVDNTPPPTEPPAAQADEPPAAVDQQPRAERLTATKRRRGDVVRRPPARRALTRSTPVPLATSSATATQRRPETEHRLEITSGAPAPSASTLLATAPTPIAAAEAPRAPAPAPAAPPPSPSNPTAPLESSLPPVTRAVLRTLYQYQQALSTLDSSAAQAVWPSVNVKALDKAFDQLGEQAIDLQGCDVGVSGARAEATCTGTASYVPKVGNKRPRLEERQWRFTLRQDDDRWLIERVDVRQASGGPNPIADR